jgi:hypothetical protein
MRTMAVVAALLVVSAGTLTYVVSSQLRTPIQQLANCYDPSYPATKFENCLKNSVKNILHTESADQLMTYIDASSSPYSITNSCHEIAHEIGKQLYTTTKNVEGALAQCNAHCRYGCIHGVIGAAVIDTLGQEYPDEDIAHANIATIEQIGKPYCAISGTLCHGIGHLLFINAGDYHVSLQACDDISPNKRSSDYCYQGVFMEAAGGTNTLEDKRTPRGSGEKGEPCIELSTKYQHACFLHYPMLQATSFTNAGIVDSDARMQEAIKTCSDLIEPSRGYCFEGIGFMQAYQRLFKNNATMSNAICDSLFAGADRTACTLGFAEEINLSGSFSFGLNQCGKETTLDAKNICYSTIFRSVDLNNKGLLSICSDVLLRNECEISLKNYRASN